jgi:predicted DNA-binding transcriptional regulator AlpA
MNAYGKPHLRTPEAADYLGLSASTMEKMRLRGDGPRYAKLGRLVIYAITDLDAWVEVRKRTSTLETRPTPEMTKKQRKNCRIAKSS